MNKATRRWHGEWRAIDWVYVCDFTSEKKRGCWYIRAHPTLSKQGEAKQNEIEIRRIKKDADCGVWEAGRHAGKKMLFVCPIKVAHSTAERQKNGKAKERKSKMKEKDAKKNRNGKKTKPNARRKKREWRKWKYIVNSRQEITLFGHSFHER